jgi:hypothetical protein
MDVQSLGNHLGLGFLRSQLCSQCRSSAAIINVFSHRLVQ